MMKPTIHMNGTPRSHLLDALCDAGNALADAIRKLAEAGPNGRDYYPQGTDAYGKAATEHQSRMDRLGSVQAELMELAEHVSDA